MWPLNISVWPPPAPGQVPSTFARPVLDLLPLHLEAHARGSVSSISRAIASSPPVKLGVETCAQRPLDQAVAGRPFMPRTCRQHLLGEQPQLPEPVLAPELEHHVGAAGLLVLLDRGDAVLGRAGDRLALVEDLVGDRRLRGEPPAGLHRLCDRADLVLGQPRALEQRVCGGLDVLHLVRQVHAGDLARAVAAALAVLVDRGDDRAAEVERVRVAACRLELAADVADERGRRDRRGQQPVGSLRGRRAASSGRCRRSRSARPSAARRRRPCSAGTCAEKTLPSKSSASPAEDRRG